MLLCCFSCYPFVHKIKRQLNLLPLFPIEFGVVSVDFFDSFFKFLPTDPNVFFTFHADDQKIHAGALHFKLARSARVIFFGLYPVVHQNLIRHSKALLQAHIRQTEQYRVVGDEVFCEARACNHGAQLGTCIHRYKRSHQQESNGEQDVGRN